MMKFLYPIVLLGVTTTIFFATSASAEEPCCQCDRDTNLYDILIGENDDVKNIDGIIGIDGKNRRRVRGVRGLQNNEQGGGSGGGKNKDDEMGEDGDLGGETLKCCPCPSKLLVTDGCLSRRENDGNEEFCRGTPISVIGGSDLINKDTGDDMMYQDPDLGDDEGGLLPILTSREALEEFVMLNKVDMLAEICRKGEDLPRRDRSNIFEAVQLAADGMKLPPNFPDRLTPKFIVRDSKNVAMARLRLLELRRVLEVDVMERMEGKLDRLGLPDELQVVEIKEMREP